MLKRNIKEKVLSRASQFVGKIIRVEQWKVELPDGREAGREVVLHDGAAAVVPVDHRNFVTLVQQHRVVIDELTLEVPAGKLDAPDEDPFACAQRELEEETGLVAGKWQKLAHVVTTPGFCTERIALYLATDLRTTTAHTDPDEFINLVQMPLAEALLMVDKGQITDAKTCLALLLAHRVLQPSLPLWQQDSLSHRPGRHQGSYPQAQR